MISQRLLSVLPRTFTLAAKRRVLSAAFSADNEWAARHQELAKLGLGGDYEWISAVQKKFIGGGVASAVDVDAAVCVAEQRDQVNDVVELIYKLRHTENAADMLPSTEYALIRLLIKHEPDLLFKLAEDPINYGIFMNEHSSCLAIDHFLKRDNIQGAARLATWVMLQEMTDNELLNLLVLYSCTRWTELPADQQTLPKEEKPEEGNEEERTVKFPYLKNPYFDGHFDLVETPQLIGKTLLWVARDCKALDENVRKSLRLLGAVLMGKLELAATLVSSSINGSIGSLIVQRLTPAEGDLPEEHKKIVNGLAGCSQDDKSASELLLAVLNSLKEQEEQSLVKKQVIEYAEWNERRQELVKAQAERVLLKIRAEEIAKEMAELEKQNEKLFFFENRLKWEKRAAENRAIDEEYAASKKSSASA